jgi:hypothetical protein
LEKHFCVVSIVVGETQKAVATLEKVFCVTWKMFAEVQNVFSMARKMSSVMQNTFMTSETAVAASKKMVSFVDHGLNIPRPIGARSNTGTTQPRQYKIQAFLRFAAVTKFYPRVSASSV